MITINIVHVFTIYLDSLLHKIANFMLFAKKINSLKPPQNTHYTIKYNNWNCNYYDSFRCLFHVF